MHGGVTAAVWKQQMQMISVDIHTIQRQLTQSCGRGNEPSFTMCVFVDELNTASALGMVTEAFANHSVNGEKLPDNMFFVGAINPKATKAEIAAKRGGIVDHTSLGVCATAAGNAAGRHSESSDFEPFVVKDLFAPLQRMQKPAPARNYFSDNDFLANFVLHVAPLSAPKLRCGRPPTHQAVQRLLLAFKHLMIRTIAHAHVEVHKYALARVHVSNRDLVRCVELCIWLLDPFSAIVVSAATDVNPFCLLDLRVACLGYTCFGSASGRPCRYQ
jgi:hypothetical protein